MKQTIIFFAALAFCELGAAQDLSIPNTFQAGTPARAAEVNENFTAVKAGVDSNSTTIDSNSLNIDANATEIQSLSTSVAALADAGKSLTVLFRNPNEADRCEFVYLAGSRYFLWNSVAARIQSSDLDNNSSYFILSNIATVEQSRAALLDLMIRIGDLPLVVDDFRDSSANEFDCSNERLLSLL